MKRTPLLVVGLVISVGISCHREKRYDETLTKDLVVAATNKNVENTKSLLARNANPNAVDADGAPLLMAVLMRMQISFHEVNSGTISGDQRESETAQIVKLLLDSGATPNAKDKEGNPVLLAAFSRQNPAIVADLIRAGADVNGASSSGSPLIVEAAFSADPKTLQLLLDAGADVNRKRKDGATALLAATYKQNWEFSRALIQKGADVNARMEVGTSLLFAAASGDLETVKLLVQKGADVNAKDNHAISPLSIAQTRNHQAVVDFLKTAGAKP
jgi:ankyrin repeat protein